MHVVVRFAARDPFPALEAPVVRVREHDLHEHVVVRAHVQPRDVEAQEREHAPARDTTSEFYFYFIVCFKKKKGIEQRLHERGPENPRLSRKQRRARDHINVKHLGTRIDPRARDEKNCNNENKSSQ